LQETKDFITGQYTDRGLETFTQDFSYGNYTGQNIIGRYPGTGTTGDTYIVGGHFDTVADAPGADDNGSAVAGVLEAMRVLSQYPTKHTIKFINFDLEEVGLVGSNRYVSNGITNGENVAGMIDFEMIGYYTEVPNTQTFPFGFNLLFPDAYNEVGSQQNKGNFITNVGRMGNSSPLMQQYKASAAAYVPALRVVNVESPVAFPSDLGRSDHAPFWIAGKPAIMLTDGAEFRNPNYHSPGDTISTINFTFMTNVVKGTVVTLAELAEVQHADTWWMDTDFFTSTTEAFDCGVKISPNPAHGRILVEWTGCDANIQRLTLSNATGQSVLTVMPTGSQHELSVEKLPAGTYFLKMENATGTKTKQVVIE
jgi:Zn-dependent M28 family amino/carboxypeptidase